MPLTHVPPMILPDHVFEILAHALAHEPKIAASRNTSVNRLDYFPGERPS